MSGLRSIRLRNCRVAVESSQCEVVLVYDFEHVGYGFLIEVDFLYVADESHFSAVEGFAQEREVAVVENSAVVGYFA